MYCLQQRTGYFKKKTTCEVREKTNRMQQLHVYYQYFLNMFRASLCPPSGEQDVCYCTWCAALFTTCNNTRLVLLKMGIVMPETCWESVDNKHLTVASCWFALSLHNLLTMHGHRNLKKTTVSLSCSRNHPAYSFFYVCLTAAQIQFSLFGPFRHWRQKWQAPPKIR